MIEQRPLRVCHIAYSFYESDNRVMRYAEALSRDGHHVDVIGLRRQNQERSGECFGVGITRIQKRTVAERSPWSHLLKILVFLVRSGALLTARHLRKPYDLVHVHNLPDFLVFAALVPRLMRTPVILDIHDILPELYAGKFHAGRHSLVFFALLLVERASCRFASHVIVANDIWCAKLVHRAVPSGKCTTILNYPDLTLFKPVPSPPPPSDGRFTMLYPGSLNRHQGLHVAIGAVSRVHSKIPGAQFHIYGEGPARPELREQAAALGLQQLVAFHDPLPLEQIARVMAAADLAIEPKMDQGFSGDAVSTKILEFMACGVPVVASRTPAHAYYFNDSVVRFFSPGDEAALAEAILDSYRGRLKNGAQVQRALDFAADHSWQKRVKDYTALVAALVSRSHRNRRPPGRHVLTRPSSLR